MDRQGGGDGGVSDPRELVDLLEGRSGVGVRVEAAEHEVESLVINTEGSRVMLSEELPFVQVMFVTRGPEIAVLLVSHDVVV